MKHSLLQKSKGIGPGPVPEKHRRRDASGSRALSHPVVDARLRVGPPNDRFEREADRVADAIIRAPDPVASAAFSIGGASARNDIQRKCAACSTGGKLCPECAEEEEELRRKPIEERGGGRSIETQPQTTQWEHGWESGKEGSRSPSGVREVLRSAGQPLDAPVRRYMESRFGRDFGEVRVHVDTKASDTAERVNARAYTVGHHIVFREGEYQPGAREGRRLLAHELTHVIQQGAGDVRVQRAIIPYRAITWADFLAAPPPGQNPAEGAGILSRFDLIPSYTPVITARQTKKPCRTGRIRAVEVEATAAPDPADFNKPEAVMDQDQSWALPRYTGNGNDYCAGEVTRCENQFDSIRAEVRANCEKSAGECERAFDRGEKAFGIAVGGDSVRVTRKADCRTTFLTRCQEITSKAATVSIGSTTVRTKEDCRKIYFRVCLKNEIDERARLLRHEQGHFDITNVMARNARNSVKLKAAGFSVKETACGEDAARDAARKKYDNIVGSVLRQLGNDWMAAKNRAQHDYDDQTVHSSNEATQRKWEADIGAGLTAYVPANAPAAPPASGQSPANPPAAPTPVNPPANPPPAATPKQRGEPGG